MDLPLRFDYGAVMNYRRGNRRGWVRRGAAGLGLATLATSAAFAIGSGCINDDGILDLCHPDRGRAPPELCCGDPTVSIPVCRPGETLETTYCCPATAEDGGDASSDGPIEPACAGQCVPVPAPGWDLPTLVWIGPELKAPPCPPSAPTHVYDGHADLHAPNVCGACQCDAPQGTCGLPSMVTANSSVCPGTMPGTVQTPFDPPAAWDGSCTSNDPVPAGLCPGDACVQSVTIAPLTLQETGCTPSQLPVPKNANASWGTYARVCRAWYEGACENPGLVCAAAGWPGDLFRVCIFQKGNNKCPDLGPYTEKHVFYEGFEDTRGCSACTCGPPAGGLCSASISVFTDDACSSMLPLASSTVTSLAPICHDVPAGSALGSKSASVPTYSPGICQPSGGEPTGSAEPVGPSTYCCIPSP